MGSLLRRRADWELESLQDPSRAEFQLQKRLRFPRGPSGLEGVAAHAEAGISKLASARGDLASRPGIVLRRFLNLTDSVHETKDELSLAHEIRDRPTLLDDGPRLALAYLAWATGKTYMVKAYGPFGWNIDELERAISFLAISTQTEPMNPGAQCSLAYATGALAESTFDTEAAEVSVAAAVKAIAICPRFAEAWRVKAVAEFCLSKPEESKKSLTTALSLNPNLMSTEGLRQQLGM